MYHCMILWLLMTVLQYTYTIICILHMALSKILKEAHIVE